MTLTGRLTVGALASLTLLACGSSEPGPGSGGGTGGAASSTGGASGGNGVEVGAGTGGGGGGGSGGALASDGALDLTEPGEVQPSDTVPSGDSAPTGDRLVCNPDLEGNGMHDLTALLQADPPEWRLRAGVQAGTLTASKSFASTIYGGQHFPYRVYASANVVKGQPVVFMTFGDGGTYVGGYHTPTVLDNLTAAGEVPPTVALFVDPPSDGDRVKTYDPPTDKYGRFLLQELIPAVIEPLYTLSKDQAAWATGGYSASGEQGWAVLWTSDRFHKFFGHNASFGAAPTYGVDWPKTIMGAPMRDLRVSLVNAPVGRDLVDQRGDWTLINQAVARALEGKGNPYRQIIGPGTHAGPAAQRDFPAALRWMFKGCKFAN
jgi:enterochelin esterase family protein